VWRSLGIVVAENPVFQESLAPRLIPVRLKLIYSLNMANTLPEELTRGADLRHGEYAWSISSFSAALALAPTNGFACLGGQL